jgi:Delta3-Delta2-enoyl-CoA isomerase
MSAIQWISENNVAVITMNEGENRHNPAFVERLLAVLDEIEAEAALLAVVLRAGGGKYWSLGIDIEWITQALTNGKNQEVRDFLYGLNKLSARILTFPLPVIAALNGHAFGDGAMLALVCDFRFMKADRGFLCFPEVDINIPFMPSMLEIIRQVLPACLMKEMILSGRKVNALDLARHQVILKACKDEDDLMRESLAYAATFAKGRGILAEHKKRLHQKILDLMQTDDPAYIEPLILTA